MNASREAEVWIGVLTRALIRNLSGNVKMTADNGCRVVIVVEDGGAECLAGVCVEGGGGSGGGWEWGGGR